MPNPNEYDDAAYDAAVGALNDVIDKFWQAGGSLDNLRDELSNAIENATEQRTDVELTPHA